MLKKLGLAIAGSLDCVSVTAFLRSPYKDSFNLVNGSFDGRRLCMEQSACFPS